jgi:hypothetical protein
MNPSFDVVNEYSDFYHILDSQVAKMVKDPFTWTNLFLPLRFHPRTRDNIREIVLRNKPVGRFYYGLVLGERSVAAIIKND